jgi:hypothetical protein
MRALLASRFAAVALAVAALLPAVSNAGDSDTDVFAVLRPEQRSDAYVTTREDGPLRRLSSADAPPVLVSPALAPEPSVPVRESVAVNATASQTPVPLAPPAAASGTAESQTNPPAADSDDVPAGNVEAYVPTTTTEKPAENPTPQPPVVDPAWAYEHRFDTPPPEFVIPGEPVRSQVSSPFDVNSGAFHGVRSVNGWSALRVQVSIPCGSSHFSTKIGLNEVTRERGPIDAETGYVYIGGWGSGADGLPVDAGLQKSSAQAEHDAYAVYWKYRSNHPKTLDVRYPCDGPPVTLELYPATDTLLVFSATGVDERGRYRTQTIVQRTYREDGWWPSGGSRTDGIILKRIISIAQPASWKSAAHFDRWTNGSFFGVRSKQDRTPTVIWRSCSIGRVIPPSVVPAYQAWTPAQTWRPRRPNVYSDWPDGTVVTDIPKGACDAAGIVLM